MTAPSTEVLAALLEQSGVGWMLDEHRDVRLMKIASEVDEASREIAQRLGQQGFSLLREMQADPVELKPLIQLFASPTSTEMRTMVYCVLRGMEIKAIDFEYRLKRTIALRVVLEHSVTGEELSFTSDVVWDAEILRHIGIMTMGSKPILHGFYAFR